MTPDKMPAAPPQKKGLPLWGKMLLGVFYLWLIVAVAGAGLLLLFFGTCASMPSLQGLAYLLLASAAAGLIAVIAWAVKSAVGKSLGPPPSAGGL